MKQSGRWWMVLVFLLGGCAGEIPAGLGVRDGRLAACPGSPNCVASQETALGQRIVPFPYSDERTTAHERLKLAILALPRSAIVTERDDYLHATFASALFGFVDDAEFYLPADRAVIELRSAARKGYSDFGVNRRRLETLRTAFTATP